VVNGNRGKNGYSGDLVTVVIVMAVVIVTQ
jgi:hypothetical protein